MNSKDKYAQRFKTIDQRFDEKVMVAETGCWEWTSAVGSRGYGIFWVGAGKSCFAHRFAFTRANPNAEMRPDRLVMHSCDNPLCVNPSHLSLGTNSDNQMDASRKGRNAHGERNGGGGKLTEAQAADIKFGPLGCQRAARKHGVSSQTAKAIRNGRIWKHVVGPAA